MALTKGMAYTSLIVSDRFKILIHLVVGIFLYNEVAYS